MGGLLNSGQIRSVSYTRHFQTCFRGMENNYKYLTELILVLNHKIWQYYETKPEFATLYNTLWEQAGQYAVENLKDDELSYYYEVTD